MAITVDKCAVDLTPIVSDAVGRAVHDIGHDLAQDIMKSSNFRHAIERTANEALDTSRFTKRLTDAVASQLRGLDVDDIVAVAIKEIEVSAADVVRRKLVAAVSRMADRMACALDDLDIEGQL